MDEDQLTEEKKVSDQDGLIGQVFDGKYRLVGRLGEGGMGSVYRAQQEVIDRQVAIKVLRNVGVGEERESFLRRFRSEAQIIARLKHPGAITIFDFGVTEIKKGIEVPYIVMELIEGKTLKLLAQEQEIPLPRAINILSQVCSALEEAHALGIVHRDLKPDNIMLTTHHDGSDWAKVLDFGVAKVRSNTGLGSPDMTQAGVIMGTPRYMAPEQATGTPVDHRTDIYSLGVIAYELVAGKVPFDGGNQMELLIKHMQELPKRFSELDPPVEASKPLEKAILKALEKDPERRPQSALEFARELLHAVPLGTNSSTESQLRQLKFRLAPPKKPVSAIALVASVAAVGFALWKLVGGSFAGGNVAGTDKPAVVLESSNQDMERPAEQPALVVRPDARQGSSAGPVDSTSAESNNVSIESELDNSSAPVADLESAERLREAERMMEEAKKLSDEAGRKSKELENQAKRLEEERKLQEQRAAEAKREAAKSVQAKSRVEEPKPVTPPEVRQPVSLPPVETGSSVVRPKTSAEKPATKSADPQTGNKGSSVEQPEATPSTRRRRCGPNWCD